MSTARKISRSRAPIQYAPTPAVRDSKASAAAHIVCRAGLAGTPGAAHQLMLRRREEALAIAATLAAAGCHDALDVWLAPLDELRGAGLTTTLDAAALIEIERLDGADNPARLAWWTSGCTTSARAALIATRRTVLALQRFARGVLTAHPELSR